MIFIKIKGFMEFLVKINFLSHMELRRRSIIIPRSEEEFEAYLANNVNNKVAYQPSQVKLDKATTIAVQRWLNSFQLWYGVSIVWPSNYLLSLLSPAPTTDADKTHLPPLTH